MTLTLFSFDHFDYINGSDTDNSGEPVSTFTDATLNKPFEGIAWYETKESASSKGLTTVNKAGNAIAKIDNTTNGQNNKTFLRSAVRLFSEDTLQFGSLMILDAVHLPFGVRNSFFHIKRGF